MVARLTASLVGATVLLLSCGDADEGVAPVTTEVVSTTSTAPPASDEAGNPTTTAGSTSTPTTSPPATDAPTTTAAAATTTMPTPRVLATAMFQGLAGHRGAGTATLVRDGDVHIVETRATDIGSGPALVVYVVPGADRRDLDGAVEVAELAAETGDHDYVLPGTLDLSAGPWTLLVWCETFAVEVANATFEY